MENIRYTRANAWLLLNVCAYCLMNGAGVFETLMVVPAWTAAPPASLHFIRAPHGLDLKTFWIGMHSVHEVIFLLCMVFNWGIKRRRYALLAIFGVHMALRVWTLAYFAPNIIFFQSLPEADTVDAALQAKAALWRNLNLVRTGLFLLLNGAVACLLPVKDKA